MNIKKWTALGFIGAAVFVAGCTLPFLGEGMSVQDAEKMAQENPEQLFFDLAKLSGAEGIEILNEMAPEREMFVKSQGYVSVDGDFNLEGTPLGGGSGDFAFRFDVSGDYSDKDNIRLKEVISAKANVMGGLFKLDALGEIRIVDNSFFAQISSLDFNFPMIDPQTKEMIMSFVGKWYGNTFEEMEEFLGDESFDMKNAFGGSATAIPQLLSLFEDVMSNPQNHFEFEKFVRQEGEYFFFEVTPKKESYEQFADIVKVLLPFSSNELELLDESMDSMTLSPVTIAYTPSNSKYFKILRADGEDKSISVEKTDQGFTAVVKKNEDVLSFVCNKNSGDFTLTENKDGNESTYLSGNWSDDAGSFSVFVPMGYDQELESVLTGTFSKKSGVWSGELTSSQLADGKLIIEKADISYSSADIVLKVMMGESTVSTIAIESKVEIPNNVSIEKPSEAKSFMAIEEEIAQMEEEMYKEQLELDAELNAEEDDFLQEPVVPVVPTSSPNPTETPVASEEPVGGPADGAASGTNDVSALTPLISELVRLMGQAPTVETTAQANELKNIIFSVGADEGLTPQEIQLMIQSEIQKNPPVPQ